jgi:hypothetical protein
MFQTESSIAEWAAIQISFLKERKPIQPENAGTDEKAN